MFRWTPYVFIRIAVCFIAGIIAGIFLPDLVSESLARIAFAVMVIIYILTFFIFRIARRTYFNPGILGLPAIVIAGYVHLLGNTASREADHLLSVSESIRFYEVIVNRYAEEKERSWKVEGKVSRVYTDQWGARQGKIILYFSKEDFAEPFRYGDRLVIQGSPQEVTPPSNPGEFDYKRFLSFRNIYHQHFIEAERVRYIGNDPPNNVIALAISARLWADATLKRHVKGERAQATASALVLGVTDGLDNELLNAYAATGAMHVLAVSGLHISIIYMIIFWVLSPLRKLKSGKWIVAVTALVLLWSYAFITGLSPSVLRAVMMFSFVALARPAGLSTNIYNTLAASAFCLLMIDPYLVMSVGFQLSYLAVLGIVYLHPRFYQLWEAKSWLTDQIWKITSVSIAAQVATFVLGLLYFHQFPNYFLLSNLLVIPVSFAVLILGIVVLTFSFVPVLAGLLGTLLTWIIWLLNGVVFVVEKLPFSLIEDIHITVVQSWLLIGVVITVVLLFEHRRFSYSLITLGLLTLYGITEFYHFLREVNVQKIAVYNIYGHTAIDFMDRGHSYFFSDSVLRDDLRKVGFHIRPNRIASGIRRVDTNCQPFSRHVSGGTIIRWNGQTIVHISKSNFILPAGVKPEWVIISNNAVKNPAMLSSRLSNTTIILDSSNARYYTARVLDQFDTEKVKVHSVTNDGAMEWIIPSPNVQGA